MQESKNANSCEDGMNPENEAIWFTVAVVAIMFGALGRLVLKGRKRGKVASDPK